MTKLVRAGFNIKQLIALIGNWNTVEVLDTVVQNEVFSGDLEIDGRYARYRIEFVADDNLYDVFYHDIQLIPIDTWFISGDISPKRFDLLLSEDQVYLKKAEKLKIAKYDLNIADLPDNDEKYIPFYGLVYEIRREDGSCFYLDSKDILVY